MRERFKKYCDVISGYAFKSEDLLDEGEVPIVKIGNISNGGDIIIDDSTQYVSDDFLQINEKYHIRKRDILISLTGSHINQPNSMVGRTCRSYSDREYLLNQRAGKVIPHNKNTADYLYYLLSSKSIQENIVTRAYGAANQVNISPSAIENIKWEFPNNDTQKKIGSMLSLFDELIVVNNKRIMIFEQMAENLYKEWFVRFRFPGYENTEFESGIPNWDLCKVDDIVDIKAGGDRPSICVAEKNDTCNIPIYSNGIENDGLYGYTTEPVVIKEGITISARGTVGYVCLHRKPFVPIVRLLALTPKYEWLDAVYLFYLFKYDTIIGNGTSQQQITVPMVKRKKVLLPPNKLINNFSKYATDIWNQIDILKEQNEILSKQRDLLLPRLMSGKLEVK